MTRMRKAEIRDAILKKFSGDEPISWKDLHHKDWYSTIDENFYVVENNIKHLLGENILKWVIFHPGDDPNINEPRVQLADMGFSMLADIKNDGYVAAEKRRRIKIIWTFILGVISILTFALVLRRDFLLQTHPQNEPQSTSTPPTQPAIHHTLPAKLDTIRDRSQTKGDTIPKPALKKTK